jgi:hypothetical protein
MRYGVLLVALMVCALMPCLVHAQEAGGAWGVIGAPFESVKLQLKDQRYTGFAVSALDRACYESGDIVVYLILAQNAVLFRDRTSFFCCNRDAFRDACPAPVNMLDSAIVHVHNVYYRISRTFSLPVGWSLKFVISCINFDAYITLGLSAHDEASADFCIMFVFWFMMICALESTVYKLCMGLVSQRHRYLIRAFDTVIHIWFYLDMLLVFRFAMATYYHRLEQLNDTV